MPEDFPGPMISSELPKVLETFSNKRYITFNAATFLHARLNL